MQLVREKFLSEKELNEKIGKFLDEKDYDFVISSRKHKEPVELYSVEGQHICTFAPNCLPGNLVQSAHTALIEAAAWSNNRGAAGGSQSGKRLRKDGSISKTVISEPVRSSIIGYFDRSTRFNYCHPCAWNRNNPENWEKAIPIFQKVSSFFEVNANEKFTYQKEILKNIHSDFVIPGTVFSTITVNKNFRTACHRDGLNLKDSFSAFHVMSKGDFIGGLLVFPRYRVAISMSNHDALYFSPQEPHGNTEIKPLNKGTFERVSLVYYLREKLKCCGSLKEELERGKVFHGC